AIESYVFGAATTAVTAIAATMKPTATIATTAAGPGRGMASPRTAARTRSRERTTSAAATMHSTIHAIPRPTGEISDARDSSSVFNATTTPKTTAAFRTASRSGRIAAKPTPDMNRKRGG